MKLSNYFAQAMLMVGICIPFICPADPIIVWGNNSTAYGMTNVPPGATNVIALAAGDAHCLALRADGTVVAWGANYAGQTNVPPDLTNVVSIAAGSAHSLALKSDGTVTLWGELPETGTPTTVPANATNIVGLALGPGAQHGLFLRSDGTVLDFGNITYGSSLTNIPAIVRNIVQVAAGAFYALALRSDGRVITWGYNAPMVPASATNVVALAAGWYGCAAVLANGNVLVWGSINNPPGLLGFTNVIDLACPFDSIGNSDILALHRNGTLIEYSSSVPTYPTNNMTAIAASGYAAFALVGSGAPIFPGMPVNRTVDSGSTAYFRMLAVGAMPISYQWTCTGTNLPGATNSILALTNVQPSLAGSLYALVASNSFGMATSGPVQLNETPAEVYIQSSATAAVIDQKVTFTGSTIGQGPFTYQWQFNGTNLPGATNLTLTITNTQLFDAGGYSIIVSNVFGVVTNYVSLTVAPTIITNLPQNQVAFLGGTTTFKLGLQAIIPVTYQWQWNGVNLAGATNSSLTLPNVQYAQGGTYSVIFNDSYETVTNNATLAVVPVAAWGYIGQQSVATNLTNVIAIADGTYHELALEADGTVVGWGNNGFNGFGATTTPPGLSNVIAIAAGYDDSLALRSDGSLLAWGYNAFGQTNIPPGMTNVVAIAAGDEHNLALVSDGTVVAWGYNSYGQTNVPAGLTNVVAIAACRESSMALTANGGVFAWGVISNVPPNVTNGVEIVTGGFDDFVLQADGSIIAWGFNYYGEDNIPSGLTNGLTLAAGYFHGAALKTDGTVVAWGNNGYGQLVVPTGLQNVTALRGNNYQNLALIGSAPPTIQVTISNCVWTANGFQISIPSQSGRVYVLEYKDSLADSNWLDLPLVAGNGQILTLKDPTAVNSQRFYRIRRW